MGLNINDMNTETMITKEEIATLKLVHADLDRSAEWFEKLSYSVRLGNEFKGKTTISFNTTDGEKTVDTTVWSLTEKFIQLKGGILIPLASITNIHY